MQPRRKATMDKYAQILKRWQLLYGEQKIRSEEVFTTIMAEFFVSRRTVERVVHEWAAEQKEEPTKPI